MRRSAMLFAAVAVFMVPFSLPDPASAEGFAEMKPPFETTRYDLDIEVDYNDEQLHGSCTITAMNVTGEPQSVIPLLLYRLMEVESITLGDGSPLEFEQRVETYEDYGRLQVNFIEARLPRLVKPGGRIAITVEYGGYLCGRSEAYGYVHDSIDPEFTIIRYDSDAYPSIGYPARAAISGNIYWRYDYDARITVPDSLVVANGGELVDKMAKDGLATYRYRSRKPSWRMDFAIAKYHYAERSGNAVFALQEDAHRAGVVLEALEMTLDLYTQWFGPLKDYDGLTVIEIPDGWGSQTDVATIIQAAAAFKEDKNLCQLYHELSHKWNVEVNDSRKPRIEEGLAMFLQYVTVEELEGREAVKPSMERFAKYLHGVYKRNPEYASVPVIDFGKHDMEGLSYTVGALFYYILHELVGPQEFNGMIESFYREYAKRGATTEEMLTHYQSRTNVDLSRLFDDWIRGTAYASYIIEGRTPGEMVGMYR